MRTRRGGPSRGGSAHRDRAWGPFDRRGRATAALGRGEEYHALPWSQLEYDTGFGGDRTNLTEAPLKSAPKYERSKEWNWSDRANNRKIYDYYKTPLCSPS